MKSTTYLFAYALLLFVGGLMGFLTKGSTGSLIFGLLSALLMGFATLKIQQGSSAAIWLASLLTTFLALFFSYRLAVTGNFMPGGLMSLCSFALLVYMWKVFCPQNRSKKHRPKTP